MLGCSPKSSSLFFPLWIKKRKEGEVHFSVKTPASFFLILSDFCMCASLQVSFFLCLDTETTSQKYSQKHHGSFSFITPFITSHCSAGTRDQIELTGTHTNTTHSHTHMHIHRGCLHSVLLQVRGPSAWPFFFHGGPPFPVRLESVHSASIAAPAGRHRTTGGEGKRLHIHLSLVETTREERAGEERKGLPPLHLLLLSSRTTCFLCVTVLSFPSSPCLPFLPLRWALQGGGGGGGGWECKERTARLTVPPSDAEVLFVAR